MCVLLDVGSDKVVAIAETNGKRPVVRRPYRILPRSEVATPICSLLDEFSLVRSRGRKAAGSRVSVAANRHESVGKHRAGCPELAPVHGESAYLRGGHQ